MGSRRLFVSIDLPPECCEQVGAVQKPFRGLSGVRPTDPDQAHVTVKFLGEVADDRVDLVTDLLERAIRTATVGPFEATVGGIGVFPSFEYISVVWVGVREGATPMVTLHDSIEERFVGAGFKAEEHEFTPHVTIARLDHGGSKERVQELVAERDPIVGSFDVRSVTLTESTLAADGPVYETLERVSL